MPFPCEAYAIGDPDICTQTSETEIENMKNEKFK